MTEGQLLPAFIAALLAEGERPELIERAVMRVQGLELGRSISGGDPLIRAFAFEQACILERLCAA